LGQLTAFFFLLSQKITSGEMLKSVISYEGLGLSALSAAWSSQQEKYMGLREQA